MAPETFRILATTVVALHLALVVFVVLGFVLVVVGNWLGWSWANAPAWRWPHLAVMIVVAAEAWLGVVCPLTALEQWLDRRAAGPADGHPSGFIAGWLARLLYYDLPPWVFVVAYTLFALALVAAFIRYPPRRAGTGRDRHAAHARSR
jgi:hypothetical protein